MHVTCLHREPLTAISSLSEVSGLLGGWGGEGMQVKTQDSAAGWEVVVLFETCDAVYTSKTPFIPPLIRVIEWIFLMMLTT